jgi:DNA primase large subunit
LIAPEYVAVLDPFSREGKELVKASPPLDQMPQDIANRATERVKWKSSKDMVIDFNAETVRADVLSFYLACQGIAAVSYPYSRETRLLSDATRETIKYRMYDLFRRGHESFCLDTVQRSFKFRQLEDGNGAKLGKIEIPREDYFKLRDRRLAEDGIEVVDDRVLAQYIPKYALRWTDLAPLLRHRRAELTKLYLIDGWAVITPRELWDFFANFVSVKAEEYVASVYERFSDVGPPSKLLVSVGERIASLLPPELEMRERFARVPRSRLKPEFFPPCIKKALAGVGAGLRNYAITVLLTSFLSYARVSPSGKMVSRMADFIENVSVVRDEIAPLIFEAAERCNPPFFKDQPQEKANIYYHLGFGMMAEPRLEDSGKSKWYRTPNCRKIKIATPPLCNPDELCRTIKNPLTYYYRRRFEQSRLSAGD